MDKFVVIGFFFFALRTGRNLKHDWKTFNLVVGAAKRRHFEYVRCAPTASKGLQGYGSRPTIGYADARNCQEAPYEA